jgi:hypothetical protein
MKRGRYTPAGTVLAPRFVTINPEEAQMADELDPKYPNEGQRRSSTEKTRSSEEDLTGSAIEADEEEFEDIDEAEEDEDELES